MGASASLFRKGKYVTEKDLDIILSLTAKRPEARIYQGFQTFFNS